MHRALHHTRLSSSLLLIVLWLSINITPDGTAAQAGTVPAYPLKVSANGHYLVDQHGQPFFYVADTAWPLFAQLDQAETERYLEDRRQKGFNTIQVSLLPWSIDWPNRDGQTAFLNNNLATPNEAYFQHVDRVIATAAEKGLQLVIGTAWFGLAGQNHRPYLTRANARTYGRWLGQRYAQFDNLIWFHGGDDVPGDHSDLVRELAAGIKESDQRHLMTYHGPAGLSSSAWFAADSWLDFNMAQTYYEGAPSSYQLILADYARVPAKPTLNAEPNYENLHGTTPYHVRQASYWSVLSGAFGVAYGADPVWNIGATPDWPSALEMAGTQQIGHLQQLLSTRSWHRLVPDREHAVVTEGYGQFGQSDYVTAARADDGSLAIAYLPSSRSVTVDLGKLQGTSIIAQWFDPVDGRYYPAAQAPLPNSGTRRFTPPPVNAGGDGDFVLVLEPVEAQARPVAQPAVQPREIDLSRQPWTAASNGAGPVERDLSVGGTGAGDGKPLTLNGLTFARGLGVRAPSEIRYALNGAFSEFSVNVGVDDEAGNQGSVVFEVWADGAKLYDSGVLTGGSITRQVYLDISGKQELRLVVTDGGDGNTGDHADWADARIVR